MKKFLVTGVSGFIGTRLLIQLCDKYGAENVIAISSKENPICQTIVCQDYKFFLRNSEEKKIQDVEVLIHAGSYIPKHVTEVNNIKMCNSNVINTSRLLKLPFKNLKKIIYLSTTDVYEASDTISEVTKVNPENLYGWSKLYSEKIIDVFAKENHISSQILRLGHVYGPGEEKFEKLIPRSIRSIQASDCVELWGDGETLRSFIYLGDVISAISSSIELAVNPGIINLVSSNAVSINDLLKILIEISGKKVQIHKKDDSMTRRNLVFDASKLKKYLIKDEMDLYLGLKIEYEYMRQLA